MIKAEDLRIGDLVRVNCNCALAEGTIGTIVEISKETNTYNKKEFVKLIPINSVSNYGWGVLCNNIEGIPLTPEILEKNGFKEEGVVGEYYTKPLDDKAYYLARYLAVERERGSWAVFIKHFFNHNSAFLLNVQHVHELQHIPCILGLKRKLKDIKM